MDNIKLSNIQAIGVSEREERKDIKKKTEKIETKYFEEHQQNLKRKHEEDHAKEEQNQIVEN